MYNVYLYYIIITIFSCDFERPTPTVCFSCIHDDDNDSGEVPCLACHFCRVCRYVYEGRRSHHSCYA